MNTKIQKQLLDHTEDKVKKLFSQYSAPAHGMDHILRVRAWAFKIAEAEKANVFLCELSAILHDVGRAIEKENPGTRHHDLSYMIVREWFRSDRAFDLLSKKEKLTVLYAIKYHWNNAANKYFEAIILRDADKIDSFGKIGVQREIEYKKDLKGIINGMRLRYESYRWIITKTAKNIMKRNKFIEPIDNYYLKLLKKEITLVEL